MNIIGKIRDGASTAAPRSPARRGSPTTSMLPRMVHCKLLRSTVPHARIVRIDASRALAHPGRPPRPDRHATSPFPTASCRSARTSTRSPSTACASSATRSPRDRARRADGVRSARPDRRRVRAAAHVRRPGDSLDARRAAHSRVRRRAATSTRSCRSAFGDVGQRPSPAPTASSRTRSSTRATRICRSSSTRRSRRWIPTASSCSGRARRRRTTCTARSPRRSAMPAAHIRVIATPNGGGFGGKSDPFNHEIVVAKAALLLDRPVKICLTREEVFYCHRGRHPVLMQFKTGVKRDGTITGDARRRRCSTAAPTDRTASPARSTRARCRR